MVQFEKQQEMQLRPEFKQFYIEYGQLKLVIKDVKAQVNQSLKQNRHFRDEIEEFKMEPGEKNQVEK